MSPQEIGANKSSAVEAVVVGSPRTFLPVITFTVVPNAGLSFDLKNRTMTSLRSGSPYFTPGPRISRILPLSVLVSPLVTGSGAPWIAAIPSMVQPCITESQFPEITGSRISFNRATRYRA